MPVRGIRGAINVSANTRDAIQNATTRLLLAMCEANHLDASAIISAFFTVTTDLNATYPAAAARALGWLDVPLLDAQEIEVPGGMARVVRVLLHVEMDVARSQVKHIYLDEAVSLRPDLPQTLW
ncbi:MAG: chorismate mutase [Acidobacteria bacterium]|nr:chorismate mutase [Acidobacteriota bacterium]